MAGDTPSLALRRHDFGKLLLEHLSLEYYDVSPTREAVNVNSDHGHYSCPPNVPSCATVDL